jgi:hypothetical protein
LHPFRFIAVKTWQRTTGFFTSYWCTTTPTQFTNRTRCYPDQIVDKNCRQHNNNLFKKMSFHIVLWELGDHCFRDDHIRCPSASEWLIERVYICSRQYVSVYLLFRFVGWTYGLYAWSLRAHVLHVQVTWPEAEIHLSKETYCLVDSKSFLHTKWFNLQSLEQRKNEKFYRFGWH